MSDLFYPLDETGIAPDNLVTEYQSMVTLTNDNRIIVPNATPFFSGGLIVTHWPSGKELVENSDFYLGYRYRELENTLNLKLYGAIVITNVGLGGSFQLDYQTIGGNYIKPQPKVLEFLTNYLTNPRITDWENVLNKPPSYPVKEHTYSHVDHVNLDDVETSLLGIRDAIDLYAESMGSETFDELTSRLEDLEQSFIDSGLNEHQHDYTNPHETTFTQAVALGIDGTAQNSIHAFTKTLTELTAFCAANGVTQNDLDTLLPLASNHTLLEQLILPTVSSIASIDGKTQYNMADNLAELLASGAITMASDTALSGGKHTSISAGDNILKITTSGNVLNQDGLTYNGSVVIHTGNVARLISSINEEVYNIVAIDGDNTIASGNGTLSNPLKIEGNIPLATTSVEGETTISLTVNDDNDKAIASSKLAEFSVIINSKLDDDVTINGHPVKDSPVLDKGDIGLGSADNTSDMDKSISTPQQELLDQYSVPGHSHDISSIFIPLGDNAILGNGAYSIDNAPYEVAAGELSTINWWKNEFEEVSDFALNAKGGIPSDLLSVVSYGESDYIPIHTTGNWIFFISEDVPTYAKGVSSKLGATTFDIEESFPLEYASNVFYLYFWHEESGIHSYYLDTTKMVNSSVSTLIGVITTDDDGITDINIYPVTRWGNLKEIIEHEANDTAHGYGDLDKAEFNLDQIENKSFATTVNVVSFDEVFNDWYRFSHLPTSANCPYYADEMESWSYDPITDTISSDINSSTYIGFVSNGSFTDYEFDTYLSSNNSDDDRIGVVIAFEIDAQGGEHCLYIYRQLESQHTAGGDTSNMYHRYTSPEGVVSFNLIYRYWGDPLDSGWAAAGRARIQVFREGDIYTINLYSFENIEDSDIDSIIATINLDLADYPDMEIFKGSSRFGYIAQSQADSTFTNIVRPDSDGKSYYGTNALLHNAFHSWGDAWITTFQYEYSWFNADDSRHTSSAITIPLPYGYVASECDIGVTVTGWDLDSVDNGISYITAEVNSSTGQLVIEVNTTNAASSTCTIMYKAYVIGRQSRQELN